jgi:hypothetical protein
VRNYTEHDADFEYVKCKYYCDQSVYNLRGIQTQWLRNLLTGLFSLFPGKGDYLFGTPYCLHFGWYREKQTFFKFAERTWNALKEQKSEEMAQPENRLENFLT